MDFNGIPVHYPPPTMHGNSHPGYHHPGQPLPGAPMHSDLTGDMMNVPIIQDFSQPPPHHGDSIYSPPPIPHPTDEFHFSEIHSIMVDGGERFGVSNLCFDTQDLLWMGNQGGHVTSYYGIDLQKYTSFQIHMTEEIRQIVPIDRGILSLTQSRLRCSLRRGLTVFTYTGVNMHDMQCMILTSPSSLLVAGHHTKAVELDLEKQQEIRTVDVPEPGCAIFRRNNKHIFAGDTSGKVTLYDPVTMRKEHVLDAHTGTLSDFDVSGNMLVTCGFSSRHTSLTVDRFLMVFDMRMMRATAPIQVALDPMFLRFIPLFTNKLALVSQAGQFQVIDTNTLNAGAAMMYPINTQGGFITSFDISSTCQALAFGDSNGYLHLFASSNDAVFNAYPQPTEFADHVEPVQPIPITDELTPLSIIPMMYPTNGSLASEWPERLVISDYVYRKPKKIDAEILRTMRIQHNVGYAKNLGKEKRNQIPYEKEVDKSIKGKKGVPESPIGREDDPFIRVPKKYRKVDLKYSKLGLEDFDFRHYNKTHFAGLETDIPNAYCNCMLQVLFFIEPLRAKLLSHLCQKEFCLSCELGFLFHMLDKRKGQTCQASNFLRAFRTIPEAAALGLVLAENEENVSRFNFSRLIQSWQRFMHPQIHQEICHKCPVEDPETATQEEAADSPAKDDDKTEKTENTPPKSKKKKKKKGKKKLSKDHGEEEEKDKQTHSSEEKDPGGLITEQEQATEEKLDDRTVISMLFQVPIDVTLRCKCALEIQKQTDSMQINLHYPDCSPLGPNKPPQQISFAQVVQHSIMMEPNMQAWCNNCDRYQQHAQTKVVKSIPDILVLNCMLENSRDFDFWKIQQMLMKQQRDDSGEKVVTNIPLSGTIIMCRYGKSCTRKGCRFRHENDGKDGKLAPQEDQESIWIPFGLKATLNDEGRVEVVEYSDEEPLPKEEEAGTKYYELFATVCHIKDAKTGGNLISHINVGEPYHQRKENVTCTQWYLFNDFSIEPIEKHEAVMMNLEWKIPCTIYFMRRKLIKHYDTKVKSPINSNLLIEDSSLVNAENRKITFIPLTLEEMPKAGDVIGLDAEFVSLNQEESELRSDGTRSTIKPSHLTVARISCIRGDGEKAGEPFIDDYVYTQEPVVDYLTQFSGIKPGDLDPATSSKHLTTLKSTYVKLRYLVDIGCTFVGHGLKKDFRVINIQVPKDQVIDTVELFHLPRQRMISLKFLAWYFLKLEIQAETHDSLEDARTAVQLYHKYQELSKDGMDSVRSKVKAMYEEGRKLQWKIPAKEETESSTEPAAKVSESPD